MKWFDEAPGIWLRVNKKTAEVELNRAAKRWFEGIAGAPSTPEELEQIIGGSTEEEKAVVMLDREGKGVNTIWRRAYGGGVWTVEEVFFSEEQLLVLSTSAMEGIVLLNKGVITDANQSFARSMAVANPMDLVGRNIGDFISKREWKRVEARKNGTSPCEIKAKTENGKQVHLDMLLQVDRGGVNKGVLLTYDITERRSTERDLLQTKERFRLLVETSPIGLLLVTDNEIQYANPAALGLFETEHEEALFEQTFSDWFMVSDRPRIMEDLKKARLGKKPPYSELTLVLSDEKLREVGLTMNLSFFDSKPAIQVTMTDLTTAMDLVREQMRASVAEEMNAMLKVEIERHEATQKKLLSAERLNLSIVESSIDMITAFDHDGRLIQYNHAASVEFGWAWEEARALSMEAFFADAEEWARVMAELRENKYYAGEVTGQRASGEVFSMLISISELRDEAGKNHGVMTVGRDISDLKVAEQELRVSEERYRDILDHATDVIFVVQRDGTFSYANPSFYRILGFDARSMLGVRIHDVLGTLAREGEGESGDPLWMDQLEGAQQELVFSSRSGKTLRMIGAVSAQHDDDGKRVGLRGIFLDITDMRKHERSARMQAAKLEAIFNSTRDLLMFTVDGKGELTSSNRNFRGAFMDEFELEVEEGIKVIDMLKGLVEEDHGQLRLVQQALKGRPQQFEMTVRNKDNKLLWYQVFAHRVELDDSQEEKYEEVSCIAYDITARKEVDQQVLDALKEKEILLQEVHHRVKNNLQVISSMLNLQKRFVDDRGLLHVLEEAQNRISTMSYIHESLYRNTDFSRISFAQYLKQVTANLLSSYARKETVITLNEKLGDVTLSLKQAIPCGLIVNELVSNALKHAFVGRSEGVLRLVVETEEDKIHIEISDDGVGLPDDFNFETHDSLGAYLVQALTDQLDGELTVQSEKGKGSRFLVSFTPSS
jgi:PAS domain S-box-containing protein